MDSIQIEQLIRQALPDAEVQVSSDDNVHFEALVVSPQFAGKNAIQRHRLVYGALGSLMGNEIHALSLKTLAPDEG